MAKSKKRMKQIAAKRARKSAMVAGFEANMDKAPSKYRERKRARMNGAPMKSRPYPPWWATGLTFVEPTHARNELGAQS